jgi:hypothetical protein
LSISEKSSKIKFLEKFQKNLFKFLCQKWAERHLGDLRGTHHATSPPGGAAQAWPRPPMVRGGPWPLIYLFIPTSFSLLKNLNTPAQTRVLAAMKLHHFVTANSCAGKLVYRMLFTDREEREITLPQSSLFTIHRRPWSCSKEELDEQLRLLGFHAQHGAVDQEEKEASADHYTTYHAGASSSSYQDEGTSSSHFGGTTSWPSWLS